ncbi:MAG: DUF2341 domain-containing protein [Thermoplasmatales archaeon]|nr:MAG: DUF2341 domain-containing protein [Thermoplasmatales archaeon]
MKGNPVLYKSLVVGVILLFIGAGVVPIIAGDYNDVQDTLSLTFYTFDKTGSNNCKVELSTDIAKDISCMFEELKYKITSEPTSDETKVLKYNFVEILNVNGLIPNGLSKDDVFSLLNPNWLGLKEDNPIAKDVVPSSSSSTIRNSILPGPFLNIGSALFCSLAGGGSGFIFPPIMFPRPRLATIWSADGLVTAANIFTGNGYIAHGAQFGIALGFMGVGLTWAFPGEPAVFGFGGYALLAIVGADSVAVYPENQKPIISNENPSHGTSEVPVSLSELSFRISDPDGDRMSYWVTTDPDIGSGEGHLKNDGVYSIPVAGLEVDKLYSWTVRVSDGTNTVEKQFGFITEAGPPFDPFDEGWQYRKKITIDHDMVDGDLSDFPVLVSLVDSDLRVKAQVDGDDVLFMDGSGVASKLYHEIESYDGSSGELVCWVNVLGLSSSVDTDFYMYYGNPFCGDQQSPELVWDENFEAVWHMNDKTVLTISDSTFNNNTGNKRSNNIPLEVSSGKIGKAQDFERTDEAFIDAAGTYEIGLYDDTTFSAWIKVETHSINKWNVIMSTMEGMTGYYVAMRLFEENNINYPKIGGFWCSDNTVPARGVKTDSPFDLHTWYHICGVLDRNNRCMYIYKNGQLQSEIIDVSNLGSCSDGTDVFIIGAEDPDAGIEGYWDGFLDELRVSNIARSPSWISTEYNNQNDPSNFYNIGPEETAS